MLADITIQILLVYALTGIFAGLIGGMLGLGGGIIIVPVLHYIFTQQGFASSLIMHQAVTTSLATIIITSFFATYEHHQKQAVSWPIVNRIAPGILLGACVGVFAADSLSSNVLRIIFGIFEMLVAIQIWFEIRPTKNVTLPNTGSFVLSGIFIGTFSTLLGIGGGTLTVPFLLWCNLNIRNAVAISSACSFPIAVAATTTFIIASWDNPNVFIHSIGYLYWPAALIIMMMTIFFAPIGARLAHYLPIETLKRIFAVLLMFIGMKMLI
ncbi:MAG: sulfite exporter TauE/SafE family protein [Pseudomonadota bacterium]|nr:sulfite exporter TauE/SafE family protein [Pseudomonadota bacterium]